LDDCEDEFEISSGRYYSLLNELQQPLHRTGVNKIWLSVILSIECFLSCLIEKCRPDALVSFKDFLSTYRLHSSLRWTALDAAYGTTLAECRAERWAGTFGSRRNKIMTLCILKSRKIRKISHA